MFIKYLDGKKSYIVSVLIALQGLYPLLHGHHYQAAASFVLAGAFGGAIRGAVAKVEKKLPAPVQAVVNEEIGKVA